MAIDHILMKQLYDRSQKLGPGEVILDVRMPAEFQTGHIAGAINIPHDQLGPYIEELRKHRRIYIHCRAGGRAAKAAQTLQSAGLTNLVCISGSGMDDWIQAGYPVERP